MNLDEQKKIQKHFERMYQFGQKPWVEHGLEPTFLFFLKFLKKKYEKAKVLDIGCGNGWISLIAAKEGHEVLGIDSSPTAIAQARESAKSEGVENVNFEMGDALDLPYQDNFFNALIDRGLFHHILPENRPLYLENILRVLKPKSHFYLSLFSIHNPVGIGQLFTKVLVEEIFGNNFSINQYSADPLRADLPAHLLHFIMERK